MKKKNEEMEKKESLKEAKLHGKPSDHIHRSRLVTDSEEFVDLQGDADDDQNGSVYPLESEVRHNSLAIVLFPPWKDLELFFSIHIAAT